MTMKTRVDKLLSKLLIKYNTKKHLPFPSVESILDPNNNVTRFTSGDLLKKSTMDFNSEKTFEEKGYLP